MIEINNETLIPIRQVPQQLPPRPSGKRMHVSTVRTRITHSVRGIRLDCAKVGGTTYTSMEARQRFAECLGAPMTSETPSRPLAITRRREIERASRELDRIFGIDR